MMLWIVVYSFFLTSDFNDEVVVLFGGLNFWVAVLLSASIALGSCFILFWWLILIFIDSSKVYC